MDYELSKPKRYFPKEKRHLFPELKEIKRESVKEFYMIGGKSLEDSVGDSFR